MASPQGIAYRVRGVRTLTLFSLFILNLSLGHAAKPVPPSPLDAETRLVLRSVSERYAKLKNWSAKFSQETFSVGLGKGSYNEGYFYFVHPNRFRYSLMREEASDFISNGKEAWYVQYREGRNKPAFARHFSSLDKTDLEKYLLVLRGVDAKDASKEAELLKNFTVKGKATKAELQLDLEPKNSAELSKVEIYFKNLEDYPYKAVLTDALGNTTTLILNSYKRLAQIESKEFIPSLPAKSKVEEQ